MTKGASSVGRPSRWNRIVKDLPRRHQRSQPSSPFRGPKLAKRLGLDLPDSLPCDIELLSDLFQRMLALAADPEPHPDHLLLLRGEGLQDTGRLVANVPFDHGIDWRTHP